MVRFVSLFISIIISLTSCKHSNQDTTFTQNNTIAPQSSNAISQDDELLKLGYKILPLLVNFNFDSLAQFTSSSNDILFYPYDFMDYNIAKLMNTAMLTQLYLSDKKIFWAYDDATGNKIEVTLKSYFNKYFNDKNYAKADSVHIYRAKINDKAVSNISQILNGSYVVEYYCKGIESNTFEDWSSLKLVYKKIENKTVLVAIIQNEWAN
jgi:hypothetical protein